MAPFYSDISLHAKNYSAQQPSTLVQKDTVSRWSGGESQDVERIPAGAVQTNLEEVKSKEVAVFKEFGSYIKEAVHPKLRFHPFTSQSDVDGGSGDYF